MKSNFRYVFLAFGLTAFTPIARAEDPSITQRLNSSGIISVSHPDALEQRLMPKEIPEKEISESDPTDVSHRTPAKRIGGYRVQIFSDNNARTAKNEARSKEKAVSEAFPQYSTYVIYTSPYWRLKVGDFRNQEEAEVVATEIKRAFPAYAREIRVVRDRINVSQ